MSDTISMRAVSSISEIEAAVWDALANPAPGEATAEFDHNPFLEHAFFDALEASGSASQRTGWMPHHLVMERPGADGDEVIGVLPCYAKSHSQGEYVFDYGWADAFERAGGRYYPKLQCTVPFTPATGRRLLVGNGPDRMERQALLGEGLRQVCEELGVSSAHITFQREDEARVLEAMGYLERNDQQFHWHNDANAPYADFDAFLASLASRKRKTIRKERAQAVEHVTVRRLTGEELTEEVWDTFYRFYMDTSSRKWGRPYLTRDFYTRIGETMPDRIVLVMAEREGRYVAGAINFVGSHTLFGRHWGCVEHHPMLHFECCYYQAIDYAIEHGLSTVEAGAQGGHKLARGYMPTLTYSTHHITHPGLREAVGSYLVQEREAVAYEAEATERHGPFRKGNE